MKTMPTVKSRNFRGLFARLASTVLINTDGFTYFMTPFFHYVICVRQREIELQIVTFVISVNYLCTQFHICLMEFILHCQFMSRYVGINVNLYSGRNDGLKLLRSHFYMRNTSSGESIWLIVLYRNKS